MSGTVAIVGRPNVGKSALFNRIVGRRVAIVHDQPGVTRDRVIATAEYRGHPFSLIDTGGIGLMRGEKTEDVITAAALQQVEIAIAAADILLLVVNVQEGIVPLDQEVARKLRSLRKPVLVVVNKVDSAKATPGIPEFTALGFDRIFPVTAIHGDGIQALLDAVIALLPQPSKETVTDPDIAAEEEPATRRRSRRNKGGDNPSVADSSLGGLKLAIVGRPNVGKSSIINALTGSERVVVSPIPGTTRDAIDVPFEVTTEGQTENYILIDTAGVRKARRVDTTLEYFTVERTREAIARCDLAILVLDAEAGITEQDKKIADIITENRRACIVVVNKWDLVAEEVRKKREAELTARSEKTRDRDDREERLTTLAEFGEWVQSKLFFLDYAPVIFTSAKDGFQLDRLLEAVRYVAAQLKQKVPTAILNRTLNDAIERRQPVSSSGRRLTFFYATQVRLSPPTFLLFVNRDDDFAEPYTKYLSGAMRKAFGYEGCPVVLVPKPRPKTIKTIRRAGKHPYAEPGRRHPGGAKRPRPRV